MGNFTLSKTDDLKTLMEKSICNLLYDSSPLLAAQNPQPDETYVDVEPTEQTPGIQFNPSISVKVTGKGIAMPQTAYRTLGVAVSIWLEPNDQTKLTGIAPYFRAIENALDDPALHVTLNASNSAFLIVEATFNRSAGDKSIQNGKHYQEYDFDCIAIAKV